MKIKEAKKIHDITASYLRWQQRAAFLLRQQVRIDQVAQQIGTAMDALPADTYDALEGPIGDLLEAVNEVMSTLTTVVQVQARKAEDLVRALPDAPGLAQVDLSEEPGTLQPLRHD